MFLFLLKEILIKKIYECFIQLRMDLILSYWCQRSIRQFTLQSKYYDNNYCKVSYKLLVTMVTILLVTKTPRNHGTPR